MRIKWAEASSLDFFMPDEGQTLGTPHSWAVIKYTNVIYLNISTRFIRRN